MTEPNYNELIFPSAEAELNEYKEYCKELATQVATTTADLETVIEALLRVSPEHSGWIETRWSDIYQRVMDK